ARHPGNRRETASATARPARRSGPPDSVTQKTSLLSGGDGTSAALQMTSSPSLPSGDLLWYRAGWGPACEELEYRLMRGAIRLGRILGIPIGANYTWFIALWVLAWSLADAYYPARFPGFPASTYWTMGLISTILLFASVVVHELGHAVAAGVLRAFTGGGIAGLWLILLGWFMDTGAQGSYQQALLREALGKVRIGDIMTRDVHTIDPGLTLEQAVADYFLPFKHGGFPVVWGDRLLGIITLHDVRDVPRDRR